MTKLGFQLYSARNFQPFSAIFPKLAKAGYSEVEGYGALYASASDGEIAALRDELDANGLSMPTGHFGLDMLENEQDKVMKIAKTVGISSIYCPFLLPDQRPDGGDGWEAFGRRLSEAGKPYRDAGFDFGWHNHDFEFKELDDGFTPQDYIFTGGPDLSWEADIAWVIRGGADPLGWIEKYGDRITSVHVKDIASEGQNLDEDGWADVGHGVVDWKAIIEALTVHDVRHYIVEHDNPSDIDRLITRSIESFNRY